MKNRGLFMRCSAAAVVGLLLAVLLMVLGTAAGEAYADEVAYTDPAITSVSRFTGATYTHNSAFANAIIVDGVDVSYVQKNLINWKKAKADGVDFAIIRVGARGYGESGRLLVDDYYKENIEAAQKAGIMVGVYFFSQAVDPLEALAEANYTLKLIEGYDLDLPVFIDYEFASDKYNPGRLNTAKLTKIKMTENAVTFLETIEAAGYDAGFYANRNFLNKTVNGKSIGKRWPVWVAQYNTSTDFSGNYKMWQYSSSGSADGYSGRLDVNFMYMDKAVEATSPYSIVNCMVNVISDDAMVYRHGTVHEPEVTVTNNGNGLIEGVDYEVFYLKNSVRGTAYALVRGLGIYTDYQLVPFEIQPSSDLSRITVDKILNKYYTGKEHVPSAITVKDGYGNTLTCGTDYTFTVSNATEVGTATVTITFTGDYTGTKTVNYKILPGKQSVTAEKTVYDAYIGEMPFALEGITTLAASELTYVSSDESVALVDAAGTVTPVGPGTAEITVTAPASANYQEASAVITVNVILPPQNITVSSDSYIKSRLAKSFYLGAVVDSGAALQYQSMDPSVARVNENGRVMLMGSGTAEIVITAEGSQFYAPAEKRVTVTVKEMDEDAFAAKYEKTKTGIEGTKIVSVNAFPERKKVKLTWKKSNSGYAVDYYQVWRSTKKSSGYVKLYTTDTDSKKFYVNSKGLKPGTTYWYKVRGVRNLEGKLVYTPFTKIQVTTKK